jgi:hypothetical protein
MVIGNQFVTLQQEPQVGQKLWDLRVGSRVGVVVDGDRSLHLYVDGEDQGVAATNLPQPCYPLFVLYYVSQVRTCVYPYLKIKRKEKHFKFPFINS